MTAKHKDRMTQEQPTSTGVSSNRLASWGPYLLFFVLCFVYIWLVVEPHLIFYCFGTILSAAPQFACGWSFFQDTISLPGGTVMYVSGLLSQGYRFAWLGSAIIVLAGFVLAELSRRHLKTAGLAKGFVPACLPALAMFLTYSHYKHPLPLCLAVSLGLLLSIFFERLPLRPPVTRGVACCLIMAIGFWLGGAGTLLIFTVMTAVYAVLLHRDWKTVSLALPVGFAIVWAVTIYVFLLATGETMSILTPFSSTLMAGMNGFLRVLIWLLYGLTPLATSLVLVGRKLFAGRVSKPRSREKKKHAPPRNTRRSMTLSWKSALAGLPIVLMAVGLYFSRDELRKPYVLSNCYWRLKQWDRILDLSHRLPKGRNNVFVNHDILLALYHTGRLPYDMLRYPQDPHALLLTHERRESDLTQLKLCDVFLEMGHVNMAEKLASELLSTKSYFAPALEKLGWISVIKGHPETARVYLNVLKKDLAYRGTAETVLAGLDNGFTQDQTTYIDKIRSCMREGTSPLTGGESVDVTLAALLEKNPHNKMAFEYLMACYLLTGQVEKISQNIHRLRDLGYQGIPTLYEEALLVYYGSKGLTVDLGEVGITQETFRRYQAFLQIRNTPRPPDQQQAVRAQLIRDFGATYFFYYSFGRVGLL